MAMRYTDGFRRDAVRIATSSGLTVPKVASDLGVGLSTLNKWVQRHPLPVWVLRSNAREVSLQAKTDAIYFHRSLEGSLVSGVSVPRYAGHISWFSCLEGTTNAPATTRQVHGDPCTHPRTASP